MAKIIEKVIEAAIPPAKREVLWLDTSHPSNPVLKSFVDGVWKACSDESAEVGSLEARVEDLEARKEFTQAEKTKLSGIAEGAEVNVQADWDSSDSNADSFIKNKPTALKNPNALSFEGGSYDGSAEQTLTKGSVGLSDVTNDAQVKRTEMGTANGVATLDENGVLKTSQLPEMIDVVSYGIEWDVTVSNPACKRIGNLALHKSLPIQSSMRGCIHSGKEIKYYLNADDWTLQEDGVTPSNLDGTDGDVGVHIMKFYGKSGKNGNKRWVRISTIKVDDTWVEIPEHIVDAYKTSVDRTNNKAASVMNTSEQFRGGNNNAANDAYLSTDIFRTQLGKPATNISRATMRNYAATNSPDTHLLSYNYYKWLCWLYYIEYANFNVQAGFNANLTSDGLHQGGLGNGISTMANWDDYNGCNPITPNGYTNNLGNGTGVKAVDLPAFDFVKDGETKTQAAQTLYAVRWRGIENPFGDVWTNLDGIIVNCHRDTDDIYHRSYFSTWNPTNYGDDAAALAKMEFVGDEVQANNYVKEFVLGETGEMVPESIVSGATLYKCGYHSQDSPNVGYRALLVGGGAYNGTAGGLAYFNSNYGVGYSDASIGFRTMTIL